MFRLLKANEIECKISNTKKITTTGIQLLLYKTARTDMDLLDETVGPMQWSCEYKEIKDNMYCGIAITQNDTTTIKWDCGVESAFGDKEKGEASDAFKRAGFKWGIGRELYTSPFIWIKKTDYTLTGDVTYDRFEVIKIGYNDEREINELQIKNVNLNRIVFDMKAPNVPELESKEDKKLKAEIEDTKNKPVTKERIEMLIKEVKSRGITDEQLLEVLSKYAFHSTNDIKTNEELTKVWQDLVKIKKVG